MLKIFQKKSISNSSFSIPLVSVLLYFILIINQNALAQNEADEKDENNFLSTEEMARKKEYLGNLKCQKVNNQFQMTHSGKGVDLYPSGVVLPRTEMSHRVRDFSLSYDFTFTGSGSEEDFFGMTFVMSPEYGVDDEDHFSMVFFTVTPSGKLTVRKIEAPLNGDICFSCYDVIVKDKTLKSIFKMEGATQKELTNFIKGGKNSISLTRVDKDWKWAFNGTPIHSETGVTLQQFDLSTYPAFVINGKCAVALENFQATYSHYNASMNEFLNSYERKGPAKVYTSCLNTPVQIGYEVTTSRGRPAIRLEWPTNMGSNEVQIFNFRELGYKEFKYVGISKTFYDFLGYSGTADNITVDPDEGKVAFDFHLSGSYRSSGSGTISHQYCHISIDRVNN